ncbi:hypothetical protein Tco_0266838 [Tanacetum coccineum]
MIKRSKCENKGIVPTEMELVLEYTQQGASHEVSKPGQYICCQNHKLIADIEDDIMDPVIRVSLERNLSHLSRRLNMQSTVSLTPKHPSDTKDHLKMEMEMEIPTHITEACFEDENNQATDNNVRDQEDPNMNDKQEVKKADGQEIENVKDEEGKNVKGSLDANEEIIKAHTRVHELEKHVEKLPMELQSKNNFREALETTSKDLKKKMLDLKPMLHDLQKVVIPRDLHPRLPLEEFVMSKLSDDAIGIYHRIIFTLSGFCGCPRLLDDAIGIYASESFDFILACSNSFSFIESKVTLFRVFQTLCKQGDWFSFSKRCAPSLVCIDDNPAIDGPRPAAGSFSMADVCRLSTHVIKLRDIPEGVLVLSGLSRVWKSRVCDPVLQGANGNGMGAGFDYEEPYLDVKPTLQRLSFYCTPPAVADVVIPDPTLEDLAVGTPSSKILAKAKASQKRKASTFGATSSHVAKRTRSALAQLSGSTTLPSLFVDNSNDGSNDDDDACIEILLVTPLRSAVVIPSSGNQGGSSVAPAAEDSQGKGIMANDAATPSVGVSRPRPSSRPVPSFRDVSGDAIHADFFPFSVGHYYATYPEGGVAGNYEFTREEWDAPYRPTFGVLTKEVFKDPAVCKTVMDQFPTPREMVRVKSLFDDQLTTKMSVLHYMIMSHGGGILARYHGLNQSHHEYVLSADSRQKGYEEKVASLTGLELQVSTLKKQVFELNDKLYSSDASFAKSKAKGKERKKKIKSLTKSLDNLHAEGLVWKFLVSVEFSRVHGELLSLATSAGFERGLSMHQTKDEFVVVLKKMANFMPESTVTPASKSLELYTNFALSSSAVALEKIEEWVNAMVDRPDTKMTDGDAPSKSERSERVSSGPTDVVVALSVGEKCDGSFSFSAVGEEAVANPFGV